MSSDQTFAASPNGPDIRLLLGWAVFLAAFATIAGAWGFELIGGYIPCQLCYGQRIPYYVGIPIAALAVVALMIGHEQIGRLLLLVVAGVFIWSAYRGGFHAGVEWDWWAGPTACAAPEGGAVREVGNLLGQLDQGKIVVSCSEAAWRFPNVYWGPSFAGWNAVISSVIAIAALVGFSRPLRRV